MYSTVWIPLNHHWFARGPWPIGRLGWFGLIVLHPSLCSYFFQLMLSNILVTIVVEKDEDPGSVVEE